MSLAAAIYFQYWGKARPDDGQSVAYHLLPYHCLDVAAVGKAYLSQSPVLLKTCCDLLNCSQEAFLSWAAFWLALHDLGKFSEAFQSQRADLIQTLKSRQANSTKIYNERHDSLGFWLWNDVLVDTTLAKIGINDNRRTKASLTFWLKAVTGHHGTPPKPTGSINSFFCKEDEKAAQAFVLELASLLLTEDAKKIPTLTEAKHFQQVSEILSWWFAGVTVLADWLGSNTQFFHYETTIRPLADYWQHAQQQAGYALNVSGVLAAAIDKDQTFSTLFPAISQPSPLQQWAMTVDIQSVPHIYLLEDVTGAGKTEAAMMLTYRLMAQGLAHGFFVGLPTMATANAMYGRIAGVYQQLFKENAHLVLAHGNKKLVDEFALSILPPTKSENDTDQIDETASARCSAWLADHNKRALLATAGVGTIDQALLAVLHSKHQSIRLLGLFNKVLVVDEVHACDAYMQGILEVLLEFHARSDGSVILLSATLPTHMKQSLLNAYAKGRNQASAPPILLTDYPLATYWNDQQSTLTEQPLSSRANVSRTVKVHYEADESLVFKQVLHAVEQGQCVGWIRNTVADAMSAYQHLSQYVDEEQLILFHARFALHDRLAKESQVLACFGEKSNQQQRSGRVMIATQVAEQSLDVDFDVLISDLAPIDRILQRAGRLQRHVRDAQGNRLFTNEASDQRQPPCLWVYAPAWTESPSANWYRKVFAKGAGVYGHHGQLWRTAQLLQQAQFIMPNDARAWIEAVFDKQVGFPEGLQRSSNQALGKVNAEITIAQKNTLSIEGGYSRGNSGDWWSEAKTPSRLGEESMSVMLAKWEGDALKPWVEGALAYSTVKVSARWIAEAYLPNEKDKLTAYQQFQSTLPSQGKWCVLLALSLETGTTWQAQALTAKTDAKPAELLTWLYDDALGLRVKEQNQESK